MARFGAVSAVTQTEGRPVITTTLSELQMDGRALSSARPPPISKSGHTLIVIGAVNTRKRVDELRDCPGFGSGRGVFCRDGCSKRRIKP
jgi:hypothetical protein